MIIVLGFIAFAYLVGALMFVRGRRLAQFGFETEEGFVSVSTPPRSVN